MKIAIIGANGHTGVELVTAALAAGHSVRAGVRGYHELPVDDENIDVMACDATSSQDVRALISDTDAVISVIGHVKGSPDWLQRDATRVIIDAMHKEHIARFVSLTGTGVRLSGDDITFADRCLNVGVRLIDNQRVEDGIAHAALLVESDIDYTVLRVLKLTSGSREMFDLSEHGPVATFTSRKTVAQALLEVLRDDRWIRKMPIVSR